MTVHTANFRFHEILSLQSLLRDVNSVNPKANNTQYMLVRYCMDFLNVNSTLWSRDADF